MWLTPSSKLKQKCKNAYVYNRKISKICLYPNKSHQKPSKTQIIKYFKLRHNIFAKLTIRLLTNVKLSVVRLN